jgi:hypothetical protein
MNIQLKYRWIGLLLSTCLSAGAQGIFPPPAGVAGTTAIHKDSSVFTNWATACKLKRGWQQITDTSLGKTTVGDSLSALHKADNRVVSLGDGGAATLQFDGHLYDGPGPDFAVFENSFGAGFLELAVVEVSSNGIDFIRFAGVSLTDTAKQKASFDTLTCENLHNLAGKYGMNYGTPFDLQELKDSLQLNINKVTHVRIIDVVGLIRSPHTTFDSRGRAINDPFPTPFPSGGFDLDAVGAIHLQATSLSEYHSPDRTYVYPNPSLGKLHVDAAFNKCNYQLFSANGIVVGEGVIADRKLDLTYCNSGVYFIRLHCNNAIYTQKIIRR